jgi:hypothetical protein
MVQLYQKSMKDYHPNTTNESRDRSGTREKVRGVDRNDVKCLRQRRFPIVIIR